MAKYSQTLLLFSFYFIHCCQGLGIGFYSSHSLDYIIHTSTLCTCDVNSDALYTTCGRVAVAIEISLGTRLVDNGVSHVWILLPKDLEVRL